ncbi:MAG: FecR domain-containing protein [Pseudomonadota bacterium]
MTTILTRQAWPRLRARAAAVPDVLVVAPGLPGVLVVALVVALGIPAGSARAAPGDTVATVTHLAGVLTAKHADGAVKILSIKSPVMEGDVLSTAQEAFARLKFVDNSEMVLRPNSVLKIAEFTFRPANPKTDRITIDMLKGGIRAVSGEIGKRNRETVKFTTPTAVLGVRGTHFGVLFCNNDCSGVPTPTGKTPDNGLHLDVAQHAITVTPRLPALPDLPAGGDAPGTSGPGTSGASGGGLAGSGSGDGGQNGGGQDAGAPSGQDNAGQPGTTPPTTVLKAGQFGYLPPPVNGVTPPLVLVPQSQAVQVRMPNSISQNTPAPGATGKNSDPECVVQ